MDKESKHIQLNQSLRGNSNTNFNRSTITNIRNYSLIFSQRKRINFRINEDYGRRPVSEIRGGASVLETESSHRRRRTRPRTAAAKDVHPKTQAPRCLQLQDTGRRGLLVVVPVKHRQKRGISGVGDSPPIMGQRRRLRGPPQAPRSL